jgi:hypothetical protein
VPIPEQFLQRSFLNFCPNPASTLGSITTYLRDTSYFAIDILLSQILANKPQRAGLLHKRRKRRTSKWKYYWRQGRSIMHASMVKLLGRQSICVLLHL